MELPKTAEPPEPEPQPVVVPEAEPETVHEMVSVPVPEMKHVPESVSVPEPIPVENDREQSCRMVPIGQVDNTYIIAQDADGLYIVDQHAAHERILFDRFSARAGEIPVQQLLVHLMLDFSSHEAEIIENNLAMLKELGFGLEPAGPNQFRLTGICGGTAQAIGSGASPGSYCHCFLQGSHQGRVQAEFPADGDFAGRA